MFEGLSPEKSQVWKNDWYLQLEHMQVANMTGPGDRRNVPLGMLHPSQMLYDNVS